VSQLYIALAPPFKLIGGDDELFQPVFTLLLPNCKIVINAKAITIDDVFKSSISMIPPGKNFLRLFDCGIYCVQIMLKPA
jgi:hypothetical protein